MWHCVTGWVVPCVLKPWCLHLQGSGGSRKFHFYWSIFILKVKDTTVLQNIRNHLHSDTPALPRRPEFLVTPLWEQNVLYSLVWFDVDLHVSFGAYSYWNFIHKCAAVPVATSACSYCDWIHECTLFQWTFSSQDIEGRFLQLCWEAAQQLYYFYSKFALIICSGTVICMAVDIWTVWRFTRCFYFILCHILIGG